MVGAVQRGCGKLYIDFLPFHDVVPPQFRPPPESFEGIQKTSVVKRITPKSNCHFDGNKAWPKLLNQKLEGHRFKTPQVVHGMNEFVKADRSRAWTNPRGKKIKMSKKAGFQTVDRSWKELGRALPTRMQNKKKGKAFSHRVVDDALYDRVWSWLYRYNQRHVKITADASLKGLVRALKAAA